MAAIDVRRQLWKTPEMKGYTKKQFYLDILALVDGEELSDRNLEKVVKVAEYELESVLLKAEINKHTPVSPRDTEYGKELIEKIFPLLSKTEPQTVSALQKIAEDEGIVSKKTRRPFPIIWIAKVLRACPDLVTTVDYDYQVYDDRRHKTVNMHTKAYLAK